MANLLRNQPFCSNHLMISECMKSSLSIYQNGLYYFSVEFGLKSNMGLKKKYTNVSCSTIQEMILTIHFEVAKKYQCFRSKVSSLLPKKSICKVNDNFLPENQIRKGRYPIIVKTESEYLHKSLYLSPDFHLRAACRGENLG